jgi:hypothetical protein
LAEEVQAIDPGEDPDRTWYERFKPRVVGLVGVYARNPRLRSRRAYERSYEHLYDLLQNSGRRKCSESLDPELDADLIARFNAAMNTEEE